MISLEKFGLEIIDVIFITDYIYIRVIDEEVFSLYKDSLFKDYKPGSISNIIINLLY